MKSHISNKFVTVTLVGGWRHTLKRWSRVILLNELEVAKMLLINHVS